MINPEILIIPDIHGRDFYKDALSEAVGLGIDVVCLDHSTVVCYEKKEIKNHTSGLSQGQQKGLKKGGDRIPRSSSSGTSDDPQVEEGL